MHTICLYQHCQDWSQTLLASVPLRRQIQGGKKQRKEERKLVAVEMSRCSGDGEGEGKMVQVEITRMDHIGSERSVSEISTIDGIHKCDGDDSG